jgi:hypothetical protein
LSLSRISKLKVSVLVGVVRAVFAISNYRIEAKERMISLLNLSKVRHATCMLEMRENKAAFIV